MIEFTNTEPELVLVTRVEKGAEKVPDCSCSQIDPVVFLLSLIGLTVLLASTLFKGFTTWGSLKTGETLAFCLVLRIGLLQCAVSFRGLPILPLLVFETSSSLVLPDPGVFGVEAFSFLMLLKLDLGVL